MIPMNTTRPIDDLRGDAALHVLEGREGQGHSRLARGPMLHDEMIRTPEDAQGEYFTAAIYFTEERWG